MSVEREPTIPSTRELSACAIRIKSEPQRNTSNMDASAKLNVAKPLPKKPFVRPSRDEAEAAVRTLIAWAGDDPTREGLLDTPRRVTKAYGEFFAGYADDPKAILSK